MILSIALGIRTMSRWSLNVLSSGILGRIGVSLSGTMCLVAPEPRLRPRCARLPKETVMLYDKERWDRVGAPVREPWQQVLLNAAELLERDGWIQGCFGSRDGPKCLVGSMLYMTKELSPYFWEARTRLGERTNGNPVGWNDTPGRTKEQVIALLYDCANGRLNDAL